MSLDSSKQYLYTIACSKTGQPGLSKPNVENMPILLPSENLISLYNDNISPCMHKIANCANTIKQLKQARDMLLAKLMNGETEV